METTTGRLKDYYSDAELLIMLSLSAEGLRRLKTCELEVKGSPISSQVYVRPLGSQELFTIVRRDLLTLPAVAPPLKPEWQQKAQDLVKSLFIKKYIGRDLEREKKKDYHGMACFLLRGANAGEYKVLDRMLNKYRGDIGKYSWWTFAALYEDNKKMIAVIVLVISKNKLG